MKLRIVSGGQTGADQAALRAARSLGLETGGWAAKGWQTEDGSAPWLAGFGLKECPRAGFPARTEANARDSDATVWFGSADSRGYSKTKSSAKRFGRPFIENPTPAELRELAAQVRVLNVAGNRESVNPGIGEDVYRLLREAFVAMSHRQSGQE